MSRHNRRLLGAAIVALAGVGVTVVVVGLRAGRPGSEHARLEAEEEAREAKAGTGRDEEEEEKREREERLVEDEERQAMAGTPWPRVGAIPPNREVPSTPPPAIALPTDHPAWPKQTELALRSMAKRLGPDARLDAVSCNSGTCRLELSQTDSPAAAEQVQELLSEAMALLPDSVMQPNGETGKTVITLSRGPDSDTRVPRPAHEEPTRGLMPLPQ